MSVENPNKKGIEKSKNFESEITLEQQKNLQKAWSEMILLDKRKTTSELLSDEELKGWLAKTFFEDTSKLAEKWGLVPNQELIKKIEEAEDVDERARLELEYIKDCHAQVDALTQKFDHSGNKSSKWDSWPKKMEESGEFNCVGATALGAVMLEKAKIDHQFGNPAGHAVNITQLSNGEWWYVDFRNGPQNIRKIEPEEIEISDFKVLKIDNKSIDYKLIRLLDKKEFMETIFDNLGVLQDEATDKSIPDDVPSKKEAKNFFNKYSGDIDNSDLHAINDRLYGPQKAIHKSPEIKSEFERIEALHDIENNPELMAFKKTLTKEDGMELIKEAKKYSEELGGFFEGNNKLESASKKLREWMILYQEALEGIKKKENEVYQDFVNDFINRIRHF